MCLQDHGEMVQERLKTWSGKHCIVPQNKPMRSTTDVVANIAQTAIDNLQAKNRTTFDKVWMQGVLQDRRAAVRWNQERSKALVFSQGLPQGSPLSPLLYCFATSNLSKKVLAAAPNVLINQFADDLTEAITPTKQQK